jgi:hypothetical protein
MPHACAPNNDSLRLIARASSFALPRAAHADSGQWFPNWFQIGSRRARIQCGEAVKSLKMCNRDVLAALEFGHSTCIWTCVGRVPTRSAPTGTWGGRGPLIGRNGSFPPASEREARMDDPMGLQSPTAGPKERDLWGSRSQARAPSFLSLVG